jgi:predicted NAD/FAD-binding protein
MSRLAIIGTGIAGLGCAHFLHRHHELTIFEANDYAGGHAHTLDAVEPDGSRSVPIDMGFTLYNEAASPLLARLFAQLQAPVKKTALSFAMRDDLTGLEWNGSSLNQLFAQRKNLVNIRFIKLAAAIHRFNQEAFAALNDPAIAEISLADYVLRQGYGEEFFNLHLAPLSHAIWAIPPERVLSFPATTVLQVFHEHGFLNRHARPQWLTIDGGTREYRNRLTAPFRDKIHLGRAAVRIIRSGPARAVTVITADGVAHGFDQVIVATHADQALRLLVNPTPDEIRLLSEFKYQASVATLHTDLSLLPRTPLARAAWNGQRSRDPDGRIGYGTHCWMNKLQGVSAHENYIVSLNPPAAIDPAKVVQRVEFTRPLFTVGTLRAQPELAGLNERAQGRTGTYFTGGYFRHGLHEDAFRSAIELCRLLLGRDPWSDETTATPETRPAQVSGLVAPG